MSNPFALERRVVEAAFRLACRYDVLALKPGNVSFDAAGHGMSAADFLRSAAVSVAPATASGRRLGDGILTAVEATYAAVRCNTNLGILLLGVPLAHAGLLVHPGVNLAERVAAILAATTVTDARAVYAAIRVAKPAGLGTAAEQDVAEMPTLPLVDVMRLAADRDSIAAQYACGFAEIFSRGLPLLRRVRDETQSLADAMTACYLDFLSTTPDSHIARKHGIELARAVLGRARAVASQWKACQNPAARTSILQAFDIELKTEGVNPGTSADLTVASLLALLLDTALKTDSCGAEHLESTSRLPKNE